MKKLFSYFLYSFISLSLFCNPFNNNLTKTESDILFNGDLLIKDIGTRNNMCLKPENSIYCEELCTVFKDLNPRYLAEVIQVRDIDGNEDLPKKIYDVLLNVSEYSDIPYYSSYNDSWGILYNWAKITEVIESPSLNIKAQIQMDPFDIIYESIDIYNEGNTVLYTASNYKKLKYLGKIPCIGVNKFKISIILFQYEDKWILYGAGGVRAPKLPFVSERIKNAFNNRINAFCKYIFTQF